MMALRDGTRAPGSSTPERILDRRSSSTRTYTGSVMVPIAPRLRGGSRPRPSPLKVPWPLSLNRLAPVTPTADLAAALLKQQVVAVGRASVQDPVLPVPAGCHELFTAGHSRGLEQLLGLIQIADAELPGQHPIRAGRGEPLMPFDAELDRTM